MSRGGVTYQSNATKVKNTMAELERAALKAVSKFLRPLVRGRIPIKEGTLKKNVGTWVRRKDTSLQIGIYTRARAKKKGYRFAHHAHLIQFGTKKMKAVDYLRAPVFENVDQIRITIGGYIKAIENENRARGLIDEEEEISDD